MEAEQNDDDVAEGFRACRAEEIINHAAGDQHPEDGEEFALGEQIGFAGFPDDVRNLGHALMHRQRLGLKVLQQAEDRADERK